MKGNYRLCGVRISLFVAVSFPFVLILNIIYFMNRYYDVQNVEEEMFQQNKHKWKFAYEVSMELSTQGEAMVARGQLFTEQVLKTFNKIKERNASRKCVYDRSFVTNLSQHNYPYMKYTQKNRHGERFWTLGQGISTFELYKVVSDVVHETEIANSSAPGFMWHFSPALPTVLNSYPNYSAQDHLFNISKPFGVWHSVLFPIRGLGLSHQNMPLPRYLRSPQLMEPVPPLYAAVVPDGVSSHSFAVTCTGHVLAAGGCTRQFYMSRTPTINISRDQIIIPLCNKWCDGYYHFTHEHLPRLALVHDLLSRSDSPAVVTMTPFKAKPFLMDYMDILGIPRDRLVWSPHPIRGGLLVYTMPQTCSEPSTHLLYMIRHLIMKRLKLSINDFPRTYSTGTGGTSKIPRVRILFAERAELSRMPQNYYDIKKRLIEELGDRVEINTTMGDTDITNQIKLFYSSDIVIGPHGANLANVMWMRPRTHIIEIMSQLDGYLCYYATAEKINVVHHPVFHSGGKNYKFVLEYDLLKKQVDLALGELETSLQLFDDLELHKLFG